jgi:hypothetical protein
MKKKRGKLVAVDQMGSSAARPLWLCRHEAAHAVVGHVLGEHIVSLTVDRRGGMTGTAYGFRFDPLRAGMATMAGHAADVLWSRRSRTTPPPDDHRMLKELGFRGQSFPTLLALAQGQCIEHEATIRRVAAALKEGDLDRKAFLRALREPSTPADIAAGKHFRRWQRERGHKPRDTGGQP